ncbi:glycoside hydrolase family 92 protein [Sphingomonas sp. ABOLD]|uniref:Putative alpha-1,2-mannosidase n=1 Tax=Sphingomonas trueperi TaxID=53317 RepID=A0A7X5Y1D8_9SPHN|nr:MULTISPECIES: GH92 family glycosyl hydrolase [Sphingomonas]NJB99293.1 putative alpha-1,2-mannosidase [Sphingomonas trueperi]RSV48583.1 glycoside hydrolase family 92 protein [Sphingomonas sp. ABOLD]
MALIGTAALAAWAPAARAQAPVDRANPLVGTAPLDRSEWIGNAPPAGEPLYSGMTSPGARLPHSSVEAAPVNVNVELSYPWGVPTPYYYTNPTMIGFTGGGGPTYGARAQPILMPVVGDWTVPPVYTEAWYDKAQETAAPGYYSVFLNSFRTRAELTATQWTSLMRFTFPETRRAHLILNLSGRGGAVEVVGDHVVRGIAAGPREEDVRDGRYFVAEFSKPFAAHGTFRKAPGDNRGYGIGDKDVQPGAERIEGKFAGAYLDFATRKGEAVLVKIAHGTSYAEAEQRLRAENSGWDFDGVRSKARAAWAGLLDRVQVSGGTPKQQMLFYSTLFQSFASPRLVARKGERFSDAKGQVQTASYDRYGPVPFWDTGRNQIVLLELMEPEVVGDIMRSELDMARERGFMNTSFHGDNAVFLYLGAMKRGIPFDYAAAYEYLRRNATDPRGPRDYLAEYDRQGWIADEVPPGNPSPPYAGGKAGAATTLEYAWDDAAMAELAARLGHKADAARFARRAMNYRNVFDPAIGFVRGRTADGKWITPFDPAEPYYNFMMKEASGWSTLWLAPQDVQGMINELGGRAAFNAKLDAFFAMPYAPKGICRDCTGVIGQFVQGNQPDQHAPYLYAWSGQPWKTQALVRQVLDQLYGSDASGYGYPGMDDQGATSSWYVLSALGFYPVDPSSDVYVLGSPIFDRATLRMGNGKLLEIVARNNSAANRYIQSATLNGRPWTRPWFRHADVANGARLVLTMGPKPNTAWGSSPADAPPSLSRP